MLKSEVADPTSAREDDFALPGRSGLLIETVATSVAAITAAPSTTAVLPEVLANVARLVRVDRVVVAKVVPGDSGAPLHTILFQWQAPDGGAAALPPHLIANTIDDAALREWARPLTFGQPVAASRRTASDVVRQVLTAWGAMSSLVVPITVVGRHWGKIGFHDCYGEREWSAEEIEVLNTLGNVIGAAITREQFLHQAQQREQLLQAVTDSAAAIMTAPDRHEAITKSLGVVAEAVGVDRMVVMEAELSASGKPLHLLRNFWHARDVPLMLTQIVRTLGLSVDSDVNAWMAPVQRGVAIEAQLSSAQGGVKELLTRMHACSVLIVPIMVDARYWGHIGLDRCRGLERVWSGAEIDVLKTLAELIGTTITRERHLEALATSNTIIQNSPTILYRLRGEPALPMIFISQNVALLGHEAAGLLAAPTRYRDLIHADDRAAVQAAMTQLFDRQASSSTIECRILTSSGAIRWVENHYRPVRDADGRLIEIEGILTDITERKVAEEKIALLARSDPLTGLANRVTFGDRLRQSFAAAHRGGHVFAVLYLDLDRFKEINDTRGHHAGDRLLQQVARRLERATRETDIVARLGGDEFVVVQADVGDPAAAGSLAEKLIEVVSAPYTIDGTELRIGMSIGISLYSEDVTNPDTLLAQADQALYRAKRAGRGQYRFHSEEIDHETRAQLALAEDLRIALAREELEIRYQPQVELATGKIVGMEALLRWNHPTHGTLLPEDFLPIAEKFGVMQQLGRWVLDGACRQMSIWRRERLQVPVVAINIALAQISMGREFVRDVTDSIEHWGIKPSDVELDVTELILARSTLAQSDVLDELRRMGVGIAIDDFGARYSSLNYLRTYHVNRLKIARGMVAAADGEPGGSAMIRAILSLANELGVEVIAEGVETEAQRRLLVQGNARAQGQGFYYSRAVSAEDSMRMLRIGVVQPEGRDAAGADA